MLHLDYYVFQHFKLISFEFEAVEYECVILDDLACGESQWQSCAFCVVFNEVADCVNCTVNSSVMIIFSAEIVTFWPFLILCDMNGMSDKLIDPFIL